jgi:hypothetical protein
MRCEDFPACGHTVDDRDPCDPRGYVSSEQMLADPARFHVGCDHNTGYCEYERYEEDNDDDD